MRIGNYCGGFFIASKHKTFEVSYDYWSIFDHIIFSKRIEVWFKGDHTPRIEFDFNFICVRLTLEWYDNRHKD